MGNVRLSYTKNPSTNALDIIEENNYYPFGLKHSPYNAITPAQVYKYKYNGKEFQDELELNEYDYGARNYDPALGRWMNIDPLAETSRRFSPYTYTLNNPVVFIDPDGMEAQTADGLTNDEWLAQNRRNIDSQMGGSGIDIVSGTYSTEEERALKKKESKKSSVTVENAEVLDSGLNHAMMQEDPIKQPWDTNGDGKLQKSEADNWWLNGNGKPITVDNRLIDWSGLDTDKIDDLKVGSSFAIETHEAFIDLKYETAATYGGTSFKKTGQFSIEVQDQKYHYNYRPNNSPKNIIRNIMTRIGEPVGQMPNSGALYSGKDYMIHYTNRSISVFDLH